MLNRLVVFAAILLVVCVFGCSTPDDDTAEPDAGGEDAADAGDVNATDNHNQDVGLECFSQGQCPDAEYCHNGVCMEAPECAGTTAWESCVEEFEQIDDELARRAYCDGDHCQLACLHDEHCSSGEVCTDNGECIPFSGEITGEHPGGDESQPLEAGVGEVLLNFPIGLSLGGYGSRAANNDGRYVESLEASHGKMHGLDARAVAVDDGQRQLVFMRAPIIFPTGAVHEGVARRLQEHTGDDWRSSLVISGTHTHSGPARFWQLPDPDETVVPLGMFGIDEYHEQAFDWLVDSLADAAVEAVDDLQPAQMGWEVVEQFDTDDVISSDRRSETPPFDDNRVLMVRIDDSDGVPRAVLTSFGTHGTVHSGPYANDDVITGAESMLEHALGEEYDRHVPVMYFNQNGGTMSPRGDRDGHEHTQRYENLGAYLVDRTFETVESMETTDEWTFDAHTHRFPILHEYLDYGDGEFDQEVYGGLMCPGSAGDDYHEHVEPDDYACDLLGFHNVLSHRPFTLVSKTQITAVQLNDLTLVTMPGELSMTLGWQIQRELRDEFDIDPFESFTFGYAQDHLLYLLPTNLRGELPPFPGISTPKAPDEYPEYAFSYLQGGYEADMSPWGHNLGDFLVDRAVEAVGLMTEEIDEPQQPVALPDEFSRRGHEEFPVETTDADAVGTITEAPDGEVQRREPVEVAWLGGDPGAEMPQAPRAVLERFDDQSDQFQPVVMDNRRPYDNRQFAMLTRLRRDAGDRPEWVVYWEELHDFPTGTYRFHIEGHHLEDEQGEPTPYEATTDEFELVGSTEMVVDEFEWAGGDEFSFRIGYPPAEELEVVGSSEDPGAVEGSYRMHHRRVPTGAPIPVAEDEIDGIDITAGDGTELEDFSAETGGEQVDGYEDVPVTRVSVELDEFDASEQFEVHVAVDDVHGNSGSDSATLEYDP